jgi:superfamily II DNA/RNA helicase
MKKYIHRVGRTARAGREGIAFTLVEEQEVSNATTNSSNDLLTYYYRLDHLKK